MSFFRFLLVVSACALVVGCANPYKSFYQANPTVTATDVLPAASEARIVSMSGDPRRDSISMFEQGYVLVGWVSFDGPEASHDEALEQAHKVGAEIVLVRSAYRNTVTGSIPITTPTASTSYTGGTVSAYGAGGYASGAYSGTTTTYGTQTTEIPYSVDRYDQQALFFAPMVRKGIGIQGAPATDEQKQSAGTNHIFVVAAVRNGSPAFRADILPGDIVLTVAGQPVYDSESFHAALLNSEAAPIDVVLLRAGVRTTKRIQVPTVW